ncbi:MAG: 5'-methylthioadenosine/adenosylhomocysteine nucleosidase [Treponema sp.]|jgi:adenosylhomocysteine nucleosidase|nr:5'-methylthioadenosine/adenosylhomocysteine nucleosidase [Treponema sp.]
MIGIIGAMEDEISLLCREMGTSTALKIHMFEFQTGKIHGKDVTILRCDVGKVNAAVGCALMIQQFKPECVINTGSAGGINPSLTVGDAIISSGLIYHDVDVTAFNYLPGQIPRQPQIFPVDEKLVSYAVAAVEELKSENILPGSFNHRRGIIGSGDIFMHEPERIANVRKAFPEIAAVEMEGAAIAHCCNLLSVPVLVIRALSDVAGTQSPVSFKEFLPVASRHSAQIVMRIIKKI